MARKTVSRPCTHCGGAGRGTRRVRVEPVRPSAPDVRRLFLCVPCLEGEDRTWRLRWRLADEAPA